MERSKKVLWFHIVGWVLFMCLPLVVMSRERSDTVYLEVISSPLFWLFGVIYAVIFYLNTHVFFPYLYDRRRYGLYICAGVLVFIFVFLTKPFERLVFDPFRRAHTEQVGREPFRNPPPRDEARRGGPPPPREQRVPGSQDVGLDFVGLILLVVVWAISLAASISERWRKSEQLIVQSEADKAFAELSFFKAQINPHFLFNTLNNIYSLAVSNHENTAASILKLSGMMRYVTEEATEDFVPLDEELDCLKNYIDLQKLRLNDKTTVEFQTSGDTSHTMITPLIFINFVENAFKYGVSGHFESKIEIRVDTEPSGIRFFCRNRIFKNRAEPERQGIGIENTKKRLEYLYKGQHELLLLDQDGYFTVDLTLKNISQNRLV